MPESSGTSDRADQERDFLMVTLAVATGVAFGG